MTAPAHRVLLEARDLSKRYGGLVAVNKVSLSVGEREIVGLIGPNGAGKTTLFNLLSGFATPTSGAILWNGRDITRTAAHKRAGLGIVRTFQQSRYFSGMTVRDALLVACHPRFTRVPIAELLGVREPRRVRARVQTRITELIEMFALEPYVDRPGGELPYGIGKKAALAMAVANDPTLLLLDEPAVGLDPDDITLLVRDLRALREGGMTICLVEHQMGMVMGLCDRVMVLDSGAKIADGSPAEVAQDPRVIAAYLGGGA